jgi:hypothetical protein
MRVYQGVSIYLGDLGKDYEKGGEFFHRIHEQSPKALNHLQYNNSLTEIYKIFCFS